MHGSHGERAVRSKNGPEDPHRELPQRRQPIQETKEEDDAARDKTSQILHTHQADSHGEPHNQTTSVLHHHGDSSGRELRRPHNVTQRRCRHNARHDHRLPCRHPPQTRPAKSNETPPSPDNQTINQRPDQTPAVHSTQEMEEATDDPNIPTSHGNNDSNTQLSYNETQHQPTNPRR